MLAVVVGALLIIHPLIYQAQVAMVAAALEELIIILWGQLLAQQILAVAVAVAVVLEMVLMVVLA